ncbi:hypothetical protein STRTUCAR8_04718 [Streptomyces turgidiscabies Car8]|uniref:Uncharacterized protein n=1 Tax=Streptomyces turgidiscabies (strain Car8) TaxID=698760 RepID=L7EQB4_STRT8|nr:hypothetical protein STRTUCAR8_04718 [Streptomyces turgidiscabies Car8]GAQ74868.1 hypothetical protein T45_06649 [Streptomyces turgidiscabies]
MEIAGALLSIVVVLAPSLKGWVDSVSYRNRAQARATVILARRGQGDGSAGGAQVGKRGKRRG